jgi:nitrite reductase (NADH) small subunit
MSTWTVIAKTSDLESGRPHSVQTGGKRILIVRNDGKLRAVDAVCPHKGGPLEFGVVEGDTIYCPLHGWPFNLDTGLCRDFPHKHIECYPVREVGENIEIQLP